MDRNVLCVEPVDRVKIMDVRKMAAGEVTQMVRVPA
jgi:hypothetical protein